MKSWSIRAKITLWFTLALSVVVAFTYFVVFMLSNQIIQKTIKDNLVEAVTFNANEINYFDESASGEDIEGIEHYIQFEHGLLAIDEDFLSDINGVYSSLYDATGNLHYGENPIVRHAREYSLSNSIQQVVIDGEIFYIFDRALTREGLEGLWLRGVVSEKQGSFELTDAISDSMLVLPFIVLVAAIGGYLFAHRSLKPLQQITTAASEITAGTDLKKRIEIGEGDDEVHQLAASFNAMMYRLDDAFENEQQFTSDVSHELRTPMSVIMAQSEYTLEKERSTEEYIEALETISRQGKRMSRLINDMLQFTRMESNSDKIIMEPVHLSKLVEGVAMDMALIREKQITLSYDVQPDIHLVGNYDLLLTAVTNLITNAYRYGKENGNIWVSLTENQESIKLSVKDDGIGIDKKDQNKIFQRFYKSDDSRSSKGTGLGLSMVYEIVRFHQGGIVLDSDVGQGSEFTLVFLNKQKQSS